MPDKDKESYFYSIEVSAKKKQEIEAFAAAKGVTATRFIKDAINQNLVEHKLQIDDDEVLPNQLKLFSLEEHFKSGTQLNLEL
jgi:hypothetical protein